MQGIQEQKIAEMLRVDLHVERPHETIPGLTVGELGGPMYDLVKLITKTLNETGSVLMNSGYIDLGTFVVEALKEGEKAKVNGEIGTDVDVVLERVGFFLIYITFRFMTFYTARESVSCFPGHGNCEWETYVKS